MELHQEYASQRPLLLNDIAYTLALRRERLPYRAFVVKSSDKVFEVSNIVKSSGKPSNRKVTICFTGQGSQWAEMGKDLFVTNAEFREDIALMDKVLRHVARPPDWSIEGEFSRHPALIIVGHDANTEFPLAASRNIETSRDQ